MSEIIDESSTGTNATGAKPANIPQPAHMPRPAPPAQLPAIVNRDGQPDALIDMAWRKHIVDNFENNQEMFQSTLRAFRVPYWMTVIMYGTLFLIGIVAFLMCIYFAATSRGEGAGGSIQMVLLFGGLSVASFLAFFIRQPLQALEDNLKFSAWMGGIYNTYWTRLMYAQDPNTIQSDIQAISEDFNNQMERMIRFHTDLRRERPGAEPTEVPRIGQPLDG